MSEHTWACSWWWGSEAGTLWTYEDQKMAWGPTEKDQPETSDKWTTREQWRCQNYKSLFTYKSSAKLVQHPMLGRIEPLEMLLQSPSLECKTIKIRKAQHILVKCCHMQHILISSVVKIRTRLEINWMITFQTTVSVTISVSNQLMSTAYYL